LDNTGATLGLSANTGSLGLAGTIKGGTITATGGAQLIPMGGTLDGVTLNADVTITTGNWFNYLTVKNGLVLNDMLTLASSGPYTYLLFDGTQTLSGTGEVVFGGTYASYPCDLYARGDGGSNPATLTIGPGITIHGTQNGEICGYYANDSLVNQGTIMADTSGRTITIKPDTFTNEGTLQANAGMIDIGGDWTNSGTLAVSGGGELNLGGTFTLADLGTLTRTGGTVNIIGTLDNTGTTLALDATRGSWNLEWGGTIKGGTVIASGGAQMIGMGGTLEGVTLNADTTIPNSGYLTVENGLVLNSLLILDEYGTLHFDGTQTLSGTGEIILTDTTSSINIFVWDSGNTITLTIGPEITVLGEGNIYANGYGDYFNVNLVNQGVISVQYISTDNLTN